MQGRAERPGQRVLDGVTTWVHVLHGLPDSLQLIVLAALRPAVAHRWLTALGSSLHESCFYQSLSPVSTGAIRRACVTLRNGLPLRKLRTSACCHWDAPPQRAGMNGYPPQSPE